MVGEISYSVNGVYGRSWAGNPLGLRQPPVPKFGTPQNKISGHRPKIATNAEPFHAIATRFWLRVHRHDVTIKIIETEG